MSAVDSPMLQLVTFADLETGIWGLVWIGNHSVAAAGGRGVAAPLPSPQIDRAAPEGDWTLTGDGCTLTVSPHGDRLAGEQPHSYEQLCRVRGTIAVGGDEHALDCLARRAVRPRPPARELDSIRDFSAFFEPNRGFVLEAARPRRAKGHADDRILAAVFDSGEIHAVADPRLSTTYGAAGEPLRAGLELWLEQDEDQEEAYPRRVVGNAAGPGASLQAGELTLEAYPLRCFSSGTDGAGVYLLARPA